MSDMFEIYDLIKQELKRCGAEQISYTTTYSSQQAPVMTLGSFNAVHVQPDNFLIHITFNFIIPNDKTFNEIQEDPFIERLLKYSNYYQAESQLVQILFGPVQESEIINVIRDLKNAEWNNFCDNFDNDVYETLK